MKGHKQRRGPTTWRFFVPVTDPVTGKPRQATKTFHGTERQADTALANFVTEADKGRLNEGDATVDMLIDKWLAHIERGLEPTTVRGYRSKITHHITPHIGSRRVSKVTAETFDALYDHLAANGLGPGSIQRVHAILHAAFEQARKWTWRQDNPVTDATPPPADPKEPDDLDVDLVAKAIALAPDNLRDIAWLAAVTGARESELCGLRWTDFDRDARTIRFQRRVSSIKGGFAIRPLTKTRTMRAAGLDRRTVAMLRVQHYRARQRARACGVELPTTAHVFSETPDGQPLSPAIVGQRWYRHRLKLGLTLKFHDLRHWHSSVLDDAGIPTSRRSKRLGHSRESTTSDIYTHVLRVRDHDLADIAARKLRGR